MYIDLGCGCEKWHGNILLSLLSDKQGGYEDWIKAIVHWWSNPLNHLLPTICFSELYPLKDCMLNRGKGEESRKKRKNMEEKSGKMWKNSDKWREEWTKQTNFDQSPKGLENSENIPRNMKRIVKETKYMETADHSLSMCTVCPCMV